MDELEQTLFGWQVNGENTPLLAGFNLSAKERQTALEIIRQFFSSQHKNASSIENILRRKCESNVDPIPLASFNRIVSTCNALLTGLGPIDQLLTSDVEELSLSIGKTRVFKRGIGWEDAGLEITSEKFLTHVLNKLAASCGRRLTKDNPVLNAFLPNGTRIHAVSPPLSPSVTVSIRKFKQVPFTLDELVQEKLLCTEAADFLTRQVPTSSILIAGNTGSGKTTTLNALLSLLPVSDRFVFVEDVSELTLPSHEHKARLLADGGVSLSQLIYESLRMGPDRLVVSEIRNEQEVKAFANALLSGGGKTAYSTFHSSSAKETLRRLILLGFRKVDLDSLGLIIVQRRFDDKNGKEKRRVTEIAKVKNGEAVILFRYNEKKDALYQP